MSFPNVSPFSRGQVYRESILPFRTCPSSRNLSSWKWEVGNPESHAFAGKAQPILFTAYTLWKIYFTHSPFHCVYPCLDISMKGWIQPIFRRPCQSMLDRIVMDIIKVNRKIFLIPYLMLPKTSLPYCAFSMPFPWFGRVGCAHQSFRFFGKFLFNQTPSHGIISVPFWQLPYTMDMVRKQNPCLYFKRMWCPHLNYHLS